MARLERWGKPYKDTRNWPEYNEQLVKRGTLYLSLECVEQWDQLVNRENTGKQGHPFICPGLFIQGMACVHSIFQMPYRQMEGCTTALSKILPGLPSADYTTLFRRIQLIPLALPETNPGSGDIVVAVDRTGLNVTNRGEWMREMGRIHRGWIRPTLLSMSRVKRSLALR